MPTHAANKWKAICKLSNYMKEPGATANKVLRRFVELLGGKE